MGLFTGKEKQQIETLRAQLADAEAELEEKEQAAEQNAAALANQLGEVRKAAKAQQDAAAIERASLDWAGMVCAEVTNSADAHTQTLDSAPAAGTCIMENANSASGFIDPVAWFLVGYGDL